MTLAQIWCGITGHAWLHPTKVSSGHLATACGSCGHVASGWDLSDLPKPVPTYHGTPERHRLSTWRDVVSGR